MKFSVKYAIFTEPYMYFAMNLENFTHAVSNLHNFSYGLYTFDFIFAVSGLKHWLAQYLSINDFPYLISSNYNTYTMFFTYYRDFGPIGIVIIPFGIGAGVSNLYYRMRAKPNIQNVSLYGIFAMVLIFSFFIPVLSWLNFVFNLMLIYVITRFIITEERTVPETAC